MKNFKNKYTKKLLKVIPGGSHTYSRGADQYPQNAPHILSKGKGAYIYDEKNKKYLDYGMGLRSVNIGYSENIVNKGAINQILNGNNLTRPSLVELKAANLLTEIIDSADMVKFTKNGSTAVTAAVKLARAYNRKKIILRCSDHPFFSYDDWFIGSTNIKRGVPSDISNLTVNFKYNDIDGLKKTIKRLKAKNISCLVLEPATNICPKIDDQNGCCMKAKCSRNYFSNIHFLKEVEQLCKNNNIIFILDEMITGFRWHLKGAQYIYNVKPDLSTFGKAMANGFSVACVAGKREIMELGSITKKNQERVFLLSTTHGAEMSSLGAFVETVKFIKKNNTIKKNWKYGSDLSSKANQIAKDMKINDNFYFSGPGCSPIFNCKDENSQNSMIFRTIFIQEMLKSKIFIPWVAICHRHGEKELNKTLIGIEKALAVYKKALNGNPKKFLLGDVIKPVFRKFN